MLFYQRVSTNEFGEAFYPFWQVCYFLKTCGGSQSPSLFQRASLLFIHNLKCYGSHKKCFVFNPPPALTLNVWHMVYVPLWICLHLPRNSVFAGKYTICWGIGLRFARNFQHGFDFAVKRLTTAFLSQKIFGRRVSEVQNVVLHFLWRQPKQDTNN